MKLLFFIPSMIGGGAERVTSILCNEFIKRGHSVSVATDVSKGHYPLDSAVCLLSIYGSKYKFLPFGIRQLYVLSRARKIIKRNEPDVVIAVMPAFYILARLATLWIRVPLIASDHTSFSPNKLMHFNFIRHHLYGFADVLTILTQYDYRLLGRKYPNKVVMYNPLTFDTLKKVGYRKKVVTAMGRLDVWEVKGFDLLMNAWAKIADKHPDWKLQIAGTGKEESMHLLRQMVAKKRIEKSVCFLGFVQNVQSLLEESSIFVLSSRIEGFPMSLLEAMSQGCACISFSLGGIIEEIITSGKDGIIVEDGNIQKFASNLDFLMGNYEFRTSLGENALNSVKRFSMENIMNKWIVLLESLVKRKK